MAALDVHGGTGGDLRRERRAAAREPAGQLQTRRGTEVVGVGDVRVAEPGLEYRIQHARVEQRRVDVAVTRRAPLELRIRRPLDRCQVVGPQLRLLRLDHVEREAVDGEIRVGSQRGQTVIARVERVEEQQRETYAVVGARRQHLPSDQVEEREPVAYRQQGLRLAQPHRRTQPTVQPCLLYTSDAADDLTRVDLGGR